MFHTINFVQCNGYKIFHIASYKYLASIHTQVENYNPHPIILYQLFTYVALY